MPVPLVRHGHFPYLRLTAAALLLFGGAVMASGPSVLSGAIPLNACIDSVSGFVLDRSGAVYRSVRNAPNLSTIGLADGRELRLTFTDTRAIVAYYRDGKKVATGEVFRLFVMDGDVQTVTLQDARLGALIDEVARDFPQTRGLVPAAALRAAGLVPVTEVGTSLHDLLTLRLVGNAGVEPGGIGELRFGRLTNQRTIDEMFAAYRRWKAAHPGAPFTREVAERLFQETQSYRYTARIAELTGHRVAEIRLLHPANRAEIEELRWQLEDSNRHELTLQFPSYRLRLGPQGESGNGSR